MGETSTAPIAFNGSEDKSASQLGGAMPTVVNAVMDKTGAARRRPCIKAWDVFPAASVSGSPVIGMCPYGQQLVYVTADRKIHALSLGGGVTELSSTSNLTQLDGSKRPVFVPGRNMLAIAGGGDIQKWTGTGLSARLANTGSGGPPPAADSICGISQRLVAQVANQSGQFWWSGTANDYEWWDMISGGSSGFAGFIEAGGKPDPLVAVRDNTNEVFAFGTQTIQVFAPSNISIDETDATNILPFVPSRTQNIGTIAPYSIEPMDDMFALIDRLRRAVITDGRSYQDISAQVTSLLRELTITDCWAFRLKFGRFDAIVWMFPTDGYGLLYDAAIGNWCEWRWWPDAPEITSSYNWGEEGLHLVGLSDGSIAQLDDTANTDLDNPVTIELVSGFTDHGTMAQKHCRTLMLKFKRTQAPLPPLPGNSLSQSGHVRLWHRDDEGAWEWVQDIELSSDFNPCEQIRSLGVYRTRQWKVQYTGADEIQLVGAQEEFEILGA